MDCLLDLENQEIETYFKLVQVLVVIGVAQVCVILTGLVVLEACVEACVEASVEACVVADVVSGGNDS